MPTNLYSATHFRTLGGSVKHDTPQLIADSGSLQFVGELNWEDNRATFEALKVGESSVISNTQSGILISDGWRVTRLPDYGYKVMWDTHTKEYVKITNGRCVLGHDTPEQYNATHTGAGTDCVYAPSEAIALRPVLNNGKVALAWTYRGVNPCDLEPVTSEFEARFNQELDAILSKRRSARFIGRI